MKIVRFRDAGGGIGFGALEEDGTARRIEGDLFGERRVTDQRVEITNLLAPVQPAAFFCIGLNYRKHAEETGKQPPEHPVLFMKSPGAVQHPGEPILLPTHLRSDEVDYEGELAVVIGKACKNASKTDALSYVLGYACANDVSARDWQQRFGGGQWCRGKTFDTFAPLGPYLVTPDEVGDPNALGIRTTVSGEVLQEANTSDMIFDVPTLIAFLSGSTTLLPGTVILTGTPSGVGAARQPPRWLKPGDSVSIEIDKIGTLTNPVQLEET